MIGILSFVSFAILSGVNADRYIQILNHCNITIWPGLYTDPGHTVPSQPTGWELDAGSYTNFTVASDWSGRIWPRTGCDFSSVQDPTSCVTGGCNGGLLCTDPGKPPATLAELTLNTVDYSDISIVDGFNVPMSVTPNLPMSSNSSSSNSSCPVGSCDVDLNSSCPSKLQQKDTNGNVVACNSACNANIDGNPSDSANCCSGSHNTLATCPSSGVAYYETFKNLCPDAYIYAYDDNNNALQSCTGSPDYTITFCPSN